MLERMSQKFESFEQQLKELDPGKTTNSHGAHSHDSALNEECLKEDGIAAVRKRK